jgi:hypothetical protein
MRVGVALLSHLAAISTFFRLGGLPPNQTPIDLRPRRPMSGALQPGQLIRWTLNRYFGCESTVHKYSTPPPGRWTHPFSQSPQAARQCVSRSNNRISPFLINSDYTTVRITLMPSSSALQASTIFNRKRGISEQKFSSPCHHWR